MNASSTLVRHSLSRVRAIAALSALLTIPSLIQYVFPVDSMAPGLVLVCVAILIFGSHRIARLDVKRGTEARLLLALVLFASIHFLVAAHLQPIDGLRFTGSLLLLVLVIVTAVKGATIFFRHRTLSSGPERPLLLALTLAGFVGAAGLAPEGAAYFFKPIFPFTEPSLFALSYLPLVAATCVTANGWRRFVILAAAFAIAAAVQNLTLICGLLLIVLLCEPLLGTLFLVVIGLFAITVSGLDLSYYLDRLNVSADSQNLSALVYLQGWQMVAESWKVSHGWGLGFQQLGIQELASEASDVIYAMLGGNPNLRDGGFVFAKLVSEFGIFGLAIVAAHLALAVRYILVLRQVAKRRLALPQGTVLAMSIVVMYLIEVFVRSAGYFVGTGLLVLSAAIFLGAHTPISVSAGRPLRRRRPLSDRSRSAVAGQSSGEIVDVGLGVPLGGAR